jgi:N-formylglutamate amidohydrolase
VVGPLQLVLDGHHPASAVVGLDVQAELPDLHLGADQGQGHTQGLAQLVEVVSEPRGEVVGL